MNKFYIIFTLLLFNSILSSQNLEYNFGIDSFLKFDTSNYKYSNQLNNSLTKDLNLIEFKFKVNNVLLTSSKIQEISNKFNGYISKNNLSEKITSITKIQTRPDSVSITKHFFYCNTVLIRVPHHLLDSTIAEIKNLIEHINFQTLTINDSLKEKINLESNSLLNLRKNIYTSNLKNSPLDAIIITIYDSPQFKTTYFYNQINPEAYKLSFIENFYYAAVGGFEMVSNFICILTYFWTLIIFFIVIIFFYKRHINTD